jgi:deazaflavin-dependent oxidoreductase (nitroreductase family)
MSDVNMNDFNSNIINEFRSNGGKVSGQFAGAPMVLITHTGAKSGQRRTNPLVYYPDGDRIVIIASKGGAPTNPDWYHNIKANTNVTVEVGDETYEARAEELTGEERDRIFDAIGQLMPGFNEYQAKTSRTIPLVALTRVD